MRYISTRGGIAPVSFLDAVSMGLANDGGLLLPETIPDVRSSLDAWRSLQYPELAEAVLRRFIGEDIPAADLHDLIQRSYASFDHPDILPLVQVGTDRYILELFHGPTLAFKDVALQFLGNLFEYMITRNGRWLNILGATSGDTGSAAIHGVRGKKGMSIFILHPHGRVSPVQERQMTTVLDANVHNVAIEGSFDDGQRIMKELFADVPFKERLHLASINSVNWARVAAQVVYYFYAAFRLQEQVGDEPVTICVPTGNFGNIFAGFLACRMGAPISRLILATNQNDILSRFFTSGEYRMDTVCPTLSPSMDIQVASNFERYLYYAFDEDPTRLAQAMTAFAEQGELCLDSATAANPDGLFCAGSATDEATIQAIGRWYEAAGYVLDPHTAVGMQVADQLSVAGEPVVCLATAHPAKFADAVSRALGHNPARHPRIDALDNLPSRCEILPADREVIRTFMEKTLAATAAE